MIIKTNMSEDFIPFVNEEGEETISFPTFIERQWEQWLKNALWKDEPIPVDDLVLHTNFYLDSLEYGFKTIKPEVASWRIRLIMSYYHRQVKLCKEKNI